MAKEHQDMVKKMDRKAKEEFENKKASLDADYASLPKVFKERIDKFRHNNPEFRWRYEAYEMFCCIEAMKIAHMAELQMACYKQMNVHEIISDFYKRPFEDQVKMAGISDQHSGNTFGMACRLASIYLSLPTNVTRLHGALAPLVGSKEYGCVPTEKVGGIFEEKND